MEDLRDEDQLSQSIDALGVLFGLLVRHNAAQRNLVGLDGASPATGAWNHTVNDLVGQALLALDLALRRFQEIVTLDELLSGADQWPATNGRYSLRRNKAK